MKELKLAKKAALKAGRLIQSYQGENFQVRHKGEIDLVTEVDIKAQELICEMIRKQFPEDAILAEENDLSQTKEAPRRWIIDPIDGTTNFAHGYPVYCVSIAFERDQRVECGVIYDPTREEIFYARAGHGAFVKTRKKKRALRVSETHSLKKSLLVTGFPYSLEDHRQNNLPLFNYMMFRCQAVRRDGSAALNLAYVAAGYFDGFWELGLSPWDCAAGVLMIREAGGEIRLWEGETSTQIPSSFIAANPQLIQELESALKDAHDGG